MESREITYLGHIASAEASSAADKEKDIGIAAVAAVADQETCLDY